MGMARCGEPSPFLRVGVVPEPSRVASLLLLTALLSGKHSHYPAFYFSILFTNVLVTKAE